MALSVLNICVSRTQSCWNRFILQLAAEEMFSATKNVLFLLVFPYLCHTTQRVSFSNYWLHLSVFGLAAVKLGQFVFLQLQWPDCVSAGGTQLHLIRPNSDMLQRHV